jgi:RNA polymerase-binding transcription factor DksA
VPDQTLHATVRSQLEEERTRLQSQIGAARGDSPLAHDDNFADSGQVAAERGENLSLTGQLTQQLAEVDRALAKLDDGTYGLCEVCGQPIVEARLEAMPATRFCIDHA